MDRKIIVGDLVVVTCTGPDFNDSYRDCVFPGRVLEPPTDTTVPIRLFPDKEKKDVAKAKVGPSVFREGDPVFFDDEPGTIVSLHYPKFRAKLQMQDEVVQVGLSAISPRVEVGEFAWAQLQKNSIAHPVQIMTYLEGGKVLVLKNAFQGRSLEKIATGGLLIHIKKISVLAGDWVRLRRPLTGVADVVGQIARVEEKECVIQPVTKPFNVPESVIIGKNQETPKLTRDVFQFITACAAHKVGWEAKRMFDVCGHQIKIVHSNEERGFSRVNVVWPEVAHVPVDAVCPILRPRAKKSASALDQGFLRYLRAHLRE